MIRRGKRRITAQEVVGNILVAVLAGFWFAWALAALGTIFIGPFAFIAGLF